MKQEVVYLVDDLSGKSGDDVTTTHFSVDGVDYEIDLDGKNRQSFDRMIFKFIENGRRVPKAAKKQTRKQNYPYSRELQKDVRAWAQKKGISVPDRGRLKKAVVEEFLAYGKN